MKDMIKVPEKAPIEALSANILDTRFENFSRETLDNAINRIIDVTGCAIGGASAAGNRALVKLVQGWGGSPEATILVHGGRVPAHNAAMVNSIMARSFDFEALMPLIDGVQVPAHISGTTVMTALTLGDMTGCSGRKLLTALLVGEDTAIRILGASGFRLAGGWCNTGTVNQFGATAVAGRLLGLDKRQMRNAFGLILSQLAGSLQNVWDGTTAFKLPQGLSARNGIFSVQLAKAGWTAPEDALLSQFGYYRLYTPGCSDAEILTRDLGKMYFTESVFKPYPCCRGTHASIDCALSLVRKYNIGAKDIEAAVIYLTKAEAEAFMGQPFTIGDFPQGNAAFSCRYTTATALLRGCVRPEHFSDESIRNPETLALADRIQVQELPGARELSARLVLKMKDGRELSEFTDAPWGDALRNPMTREDIMEKYYVNIAYSKTIPEDKSRQVLDLLLNLEKVKNIRDIIELLTP
jgi:2-methylcitrate dehydratase PrpD